MYFVSSIIRGSLSSSSVQQCYFLYISYPHNDSFVFSHRVLIKKENEVWGKKELIFINWAFCTIAFAVGIEKKNTLSSHVTLHLSSGGTLPPPLPPYTHARHDCILIPLCESYFLPVVFFHCSVTLSLSVGCNPSLLSDFFFFFFLLRDLPTLNSASLPRFHAWQHNLIPLGTIVF